MAKRNRITMAVDDKLPTIKPLVNPLHRAHASGLSRQVSVDNPVNYADIEKSRRMSLNGSANGHRSRALNQIQTLLSKNDQQLASSPPLMRSMSSGMRERQQSNEYPGAESPTRHSVVLQSAGPTHGPHDSTYERQPSFTLSDTSETDYLDADDGEDRPSGIERHPRKNKLNSEEWRSMAKFAKVQGVDLQKQIEEQKKTRLAPDHQQQASRAEDLEEMRRLIQNSRRRSSESFFTPTDQTSGETDHESSAKGRRTSDVSSNLLDEEALQERSQSRRESTVSDQVDNEIAQLIVDDPAKVFEWLIGNKELDGERRIEVSEDRTMNLLQALTEGDAAATNHVGTWHGSTRSIESRDWVPAEKLKEAKRRSSVAEEQLKQLEHMFKGENAGENDQDLALLFNRMKAIERNMFFLKKFADDKQVELKKQLMSAEKGVRMVRCPPSTQFNSPEQIKKNMQEMDNHKKRLNVVNYALSDLIKLLKAVQTKRGYAEHKVQQLSSQLKRQMTTLKRTEKVLKPHGVSPYEHPSFRKSEKTSLTSPSPSGRQSPSILSGVQQSSASLSGMQSPALDYSGDGDDNDDDDDDEDEDVDRDDNGIGYHGRRTQRNRHVRGHAAHYELAEAQIRDKLVQEAYPDASAPLSDTRVMTGDLPDVLDHSVNVEHTLAHDRLAEQPGAAKLTTSDLISENHKGEFEDIESAMLEQGRAQGFTDVDIYSEKKIVAKDETSWEYKHVHVDFNKVPEMVSHPSESDMWDNWNFQSLSNVPISSRTASPSRSENLALNSHPSNVGDAVEFHSNSVKGLALIAGAIEKEAAFLVHALKGDTTAELSRQKVKEHGLQNIGSSKTEAEGSGKQTAQGSEARQVTAELVENRSDSEERRQQQQSNPVLSNEAKVRQGQQPKPYRRSKSLPIHAIKLAPFSPESGDNKGAIVELGSSAIVSADLEKIGLRSQPEPKASNECAEKLLVEEDKHEIPVNQLRTQETGNARNPELSHEIPANQVRFQETAGDARELEVRRKGGHAAGIAHDANRPDHTSGNATEASVRSEVQGMDAVYRGKEPSPREHGKRAPVAPYDATTEQALTWAQRVPLQDQELVASSSSSQLASQERSDDCSGSTLRVETLDLQRRLLQVETKQQEQHLQCEFKRQGQLFLVQLLLLSSAFVWSGFPTWWHIAPPPT